MSEQEFPLVFVWGNNSRRAELRGRRCRVIVRGRMSTVLLEFANGERVTTSRRAVRRADPGSQLILCV